MNYCIVAFAIIIVIALTQWIVEGRRQYTGPRINTAALQQGEVVGMVDEGEKETDAL